MSERPATRTFSHEPPSCGPELSLEPLTVAHAEEMAGVLSDPALYQYIGGSPPGVEGLRQRYEWLVKGSPELSVRWFNWVVRRSDGTAVGFVQATVGPGHGGPSAVIAWMVGAPWQGRGFATRASHALVLWLREHGVRRITAHIHPDNTASEAVARAVGLHRTNRWDDGEMVWTDRQ